MMRRTHRFRAVPVDADVNFHDVEPHGARAFPQPAQIRLRRPLQRGAFPRVHGVNRAVRVRFRPRFDFDENERFAVPRRDVDFIASRAKIPAENFHSAFFFQKLRGEFFARVAAFPQAGFGVPAAEKKTFRPREFFCKKIRNAAGDA